MGVNVCFMNNALQLLQIWLLTERRQTDIDRKIDPAGHVPRVGWGGADFNSFIQ